MKITDLLFAWHTPRKGRSSQTEESVPIRQILPLKLKDRVSGKYDRKKEGNCLHEMILVISCLQENEYQNKLCQKEVKSFNDCYKTYLNEKSMGKKARLQGILVPGEKNLTHKQVGKLLKFRPIL